MAYITEQSDMRRDAQAAKEAEAAIDNVCDIDHSVEAKAKGVYVATDVLPSLVPTAFCMPS